LEAITSSGNYLGTDRLNRALTKEEKRAFEKLLRMHDFVGASMVALRFAYKLMRNRERAQDLIGRMNLRLVRQGWDPNVVSLVKRLCRLVWSEYTNALSETDAARRAEEIHLRQEAAEGHALPAAPQRGDPLRQGNVRATNARFTPSVEQGIIDAGEQAKADERDEAELAEMRANLGRARAIFESKNDEVNLIFLDNLMAGKTDVNQMAVDSGRDVAELYAAQKRRKRVVERILAEKNGVPPDDEENE
jgi:hypothetical protein